MTMARQQRKKGHFSYMEENFPLVTLAALALLGRLAYADLEDAGCRKMEVVATEKGWASHGDNNEAAAVTDNARTYNYNLHTGLAKNKDCARLRVVLVGFHESGNLHFGLAYHHNALE